MTNLIVRDSLAADVTITPPDNHAVTGNHDRSTSHQSQASESETCVVRPRSKSEIAPKYQVDVDEYPGMFE